jgi:adenylosuccinate synthase
MTGRKMIEMPGWKSSTAGFTKWEELPENAKKYIELIETETSVPCAMIGTGQGREEMIIRT